LTIADLDDISLGPMEGVNTSPMIKLSVHDDSGNATPSILEEDEDDMMTEDEEVDDEVSGMSKF
jgi:hypothetical protein